MVTKGDPGSGHHGHRGIPGQRGGSAPGGGGGYSPMQPVELGSDSWQYPTDRKLDLLLSTGLPEPWEYATEEMRGKVKASISRSLSERAGLVTPKEASDTLGVWAKSSGDTKPESLILQQAAAEEFGVPISKYHQAHIDDFRNGSAGGQELLVRAESDLGRNRTVLRAAQEETQSWFKENGYGPNDTVIAYRGIYADEVPKALQWMSQYENRVVPSTGNTLESWSVSPRVAERFANSGSWESLRYLLAARIPVSRIVSTCRTGLGCLTEGELVVLRNGAKIDDVTFTRL